MNVHLKNVLLIIVDQVLRWWRRSLFGQLLLLGIMLGAVIGVQCPLPFFPMVILFLTAWKLIPNFKQQIEGISSKKFGLMMGAISAVVAFIFTASSFPPLVAGWAALTNFVAVTFAIWLVSSSLEEMEQYWWRDVLVFVLSGIIVAGMTWTLIEVVAPRVYEYQHPEPVPEHCVRKIGLTTRYLICNGIVVERRDWVEEDRIAKFRKAIRQGESP